VIEDLIIPPPLKAGDTVAVLSPSFPAVAAWPHRVTQGKAYLENLGLKVRLMPNASGDAGWVSGSPQARTADIHQAFEDPEIGLIIASIGGNHSNQLLPYLDYDLIRDHPTIFQGYSDTTVLLWAVLQKAGLQTFHGPALVSELGEHPAPLPYTDRWLRAAWFTDDRLIFEPAAEWTDEFLDWDVQEDRARPRMMKPATSWIALRGGTAEGWLLGGCLETICWHLKGSSVWPGLSGAILFLETSEEAPSPAHVDAYLTDLELLGVFDQIAGLVVGRAYGYADELTAELHRVVATRTEGSGIPVIANVDLGHSDPMLTLPLGAPATLDADKLTFSVRT
jgi:muramoyltetrapeptide carboxypeptidase LdcA involved in peptidoglycan recycling